MTGDPPESWTPISAPTFASADGFVRGLASSWGAEVWLERDSGGRLGVCSYLGFHSSVRGFGLDVILWVIGPDQPRSGASLRGAEATTASGPPRRGAGS